MATSKQTIASLTELLGPGARARAMMGEYVLYWRERVVGGVYDERLLLKDVPAVREAVPDAPLEEPYPGAKPARRLPLPANEQEAGALIEVLEALWEQVPT
ncbi:Regulator of competence-specific genes [Actinomyces bovis]|uniref:Regulator of competence-specific genes n=1 Tax=Actinomyces bovis TaxID=1658 RepID=A0ABY1VNN3_9ACTO|nr:hypothetical protein [Actinomyces bovis]SPT52678.1 Regulator of competence-specific genes [Actinomyces bovis]VEG54600.1 Regulator of competence-specific genes [Actinomyces israelii]